MVNPDVGLRWEVAINDVGYMLADAPDQEITYRRLISVLEPQRFADGATPVSESIERYSFFNSSEWRGGAGQRFLNRANSDQSSYWDSQGLDVFCECQRLHLLPSVDLKQASATSAMAVAGGEYLLMQDTGQVEQHTISGDTVTPGNTHAYTATDLDIGYGKGFIATGTDLREITLGSAGDSQLSTLDCHRVAWIGDRLAVLYRHSDATTWRFSSLSTSGAEEVTDGHLTLPGATSASMGSCEYRLGGIASGINYVWFSGWTQDGEEGHIYVWNIDTTLAPFIAMTMPKGEIPIDLFFYQGGLYIWAAERNGGVVKIYRGVVNGDGTITPFLVVSDAGSAPASLLYDGPKFAAKSEELFFAWNGMQTNGGFGVLHLPTGGYSKRGHADLSGEVVSTFVWGNRPGCAVNARGAYLEHSTNLESTGWLRTSIADADSALDKHWDSVSFNANQEAGTDVDISYTLDGGDTYVAVISNSTDEEAVAALGLEGASLGLQITLDGDGATATPYVRVVSAKFHPRGILDEVFVLPINCSDNIKDLKGSPIQRPVDTGVDQARSLSLLAGNAVTVQDVDYQKTNATYDLEVVAVDVRRFLQTYDPSVARGRAGLVAMVTLRRDVDLTEATGPSNTAPVINDPGTQNDSVDVGITPVQLTATDSDSDPLTWGASGLPTGLTISRSGLVTGTPTETGAFSVTAYANDGQGGQDDQAFTWNVV